MMPDELLPDEPLVAASPADDEPEDEKEGRGRFVSEFVRRTALAGLSAVFMSEEGVRRLASQLKLPKEALGFLLAQADKTKDELGRIIAEEVRKVLQSERLRDELQSLLAGMTIEVKAEIRLLPASSPPKPKSEAAEPPRASPAIQVRELKLRPTAERRRRRGSSDETS